MQFLPIRHGRNRFSCPNMEKRRNSLIITLWWWISLETRVEQTILQKGGWVELVSECTLCWLSLALTSPFRACLLSAHRYQTLEQKVFSICGRSFLPPSLLVSLLPCPFQPCSLCSLSSTICPLTVQGPRRATCTLEKKNHLLLASKKMT